MTFEIASDIFAFWFAGEQLISDPDIPRFYTHCTRKKTKQLKNFRTRIILSL